MAIYAIGDIHGHAQLFDQLLNKINFNSDRDQLWLVGDLVNRGPDSLGVVKRVYALRDNIKLVLGNHDFALLAYAQKPTEAFAQFQTIVSDSKGEQYIDWLRHQPVLYHDAQINWTMVHAGLAPQWGLEEAQAAAADLEQFIQTSSTDRPLKSLYGNHGRSANIGNDQRLKLTYYANVFMRQRFVDSQGELDFGYKGPVQGSPQGYKPWFSLPAKWREQGHQIVFGHWSALEAVFYDQDQVVCLDTGVAWRGQLSAMRLDATPYQLIFVS